MKNKNYSNSIALVVVGLLLFSCGKEPLQSEAPSLIGEWKHYHSASSWDVVYIGEDGLGNVKWYTNNKLFQETKTKEWFVKDNELFLGKVTFSFKPYSMDLYPTTVAADEISGFDTLMSGDEKIELNQLTFKKIN